MKSEFYLSRHVYDVTLYCKPPRRYRINTPARLEPGLFVDFGLNTSHLKI